jgi:hydrogenase nickel incorporation protein HypA/HybF
MHELSIALSLLDVAAEEASRLGACRVAAIHVQLGHLSGVVREALASAFELARAESSLANCELVIEEVPTVVHCPGCGADRLVMSIQQICCSVCGIPTPQVIRGRELELVALEIET